jgi:hypothetical protein
MRRQLLRLLLLVSLSAFVTVLLVFSLEGGASLWTKWQATDGVPPFREVSHCEYDAELGWRHEANKHVPDLYGPGVGLRTNGQHLRGARDHALADTADTYRILCLGDSFTMGYGVNDGEEFPALVAQALLRRDAGAPPVVNAGIGDSGNGYWIKFLRTRGEALAPRLVVMQVFENDFSDNLGEGLFALDADGQLVERAVPAPGLMRKAQRVIDAVPLLPASHLVGLMRQVGLPSRAGAPPRPTRDELTLRVLEEAVRSAEARNLDMLAMVVGLSQARRELVTGLFKRHGVPAVVLPSKDERPDLYYVVDGHWNAAGHAFAADALVHAITRTCASGCRAGR